MEFVELHGDSDYKTQTLTLLSFKSFTVLEISLHRHAYFDPNIQITLLVGVEGLLRFAVHTGPVCLSLGLFTPNL
jgi:hypothetical protein